MPQLNVDLQDGFTGELVILRIDGEEVHRSHPKTRVQLGLAETCRFELPPSEGRVTLEVESPAQGVSGSYGFVPAAEQSVGVSLDSSGAVSFRTSAEPFGYV